MSKRLRKNSEIKAPSILLVQDGKEPEKMTPEDALKMAEAAGLDLVEVSPLAKPPVCKIIDYGAYLYNQKKKEQAQRKASKKAETKTIRLSIRTESHDLEVKAKQARKFLEARHPIKAVVIFRGREITHMDLGKDKLDAFAKILGDISKIDQEPKRQGYQMIMILSPTTNK